ncbi:MAG: mannose-1-phosphate guanylyltransferase/mannose-6-phosphate isomerase [Desulfonatronovibrionaceae bacterium]
MIVPVIMAGGSGTRLWPMSRQLYPKQYQSFGRDRSLLQETVDRLQGLDCRDLILVCHESQRFLAAEQLREADMMNPDIILEPEPRNTAPAIALAAIQALNLDPDPVLLVLAADHYIQDVPAFHQGIARGLELSRQNRLVTFGIVPTSAETGYGYIRAGREIPGAGHQVAAFVEKPDPETARTYVQKGGYFWNSGMFMFRAKQYLDQLEKFSPKILECCRTAMSRAVRDLDFTRVDRETFVSCPSDSIDYAVMEKTDQAAMVPLDAGWCDVGSWSALWEVSSRDEQGNALSGDVIVMDTADSLILSESRLVAALGVKDLVVVETKDVVLVAGREKAQHIKSLVNELKKNNREEHITHREVFRPWGSYDSVESGNRYQVKRIKVKPGAKLSVQMHHHRAEHWIVVSGTARVTNGQESFLVTENQSTYIPVGQNHSLENPGKIPLELIEVQSGSYLGEDDIVRIKDRYGRS